MSRKPEEKTKNVPPFFKLYDSYEMDHKKKG